MFLTLFSGTNRQEFRKRIENMIADSKAKVGWDLVSDYHFFVPMNSSRHLLKKPRPEAFKAHTFGMLLNKVKNQKMIQSLQNC